MGDAGEVEWEPARRDPPGREVQALLARLRAGDPTPLHRQGVRRARSTVAARRPPLAPGTDVDVGDLELVTGAAALPARRYTPAGGADRQGAVVYFHGGGWMLGGLDESDGVCRALTAASGCELVSVAYRLAPEHPYPAAVDDAEAALRALGAALPDGARLVVVGEDAGANLATVAARRLRDAGGPPIALQVLVCPVTDHRMATASYAKHGSGYLLTAADMRWFWGSYAPAAEDRASPDASPLLADDVAGLPPALIVVAEYDVLSDEGITYGDLLADAGLEVSVERYEGMIHGFLPLLGILREADEAVAAIGAAIRTALA